MLICVERENFSEKGPSVVIFWRRFCQRTVEFQWLCRSIKMCVRIIFIWCNTRDFNPTYCSMESTFVLVIQSMCYFPLDIIVSKVLHRVPFLDVKAEIYCSILETILLLWLPRVLDLCFAFLPITGWIQTDKSFYLILTLRSLNMCKHLLRRTFLSLKMCAQPSCHIV